MLLSDNALDKTWAAVLAVLIDISLTACSIPLEPWTQDPKEIAAYDTTVNAVNSVTFSPDGKTLIAGCKNNKILLWNARTGELLQTLTGHEGWIWGVAFSPDGKFLASGGTDRTIILWDVHINDPLGMLERIDPIRSLAFSPDGETLAASTTNRIVRLWNVKTGEKLQVLSNPRPMSK